MVVTIVEPIVILGEKHGMHVIVMLGIVHQRHRIQSHRTVQDVPQIQHIHHQNLLVYVILDTHHH